MTGQCHGSLFSDCIFYWQGLGNMIKPHPPNTLVCGSHLWLQPHPTTPNGEALVLLITICKSWSYHITISMDIMIPSVVLVIGPLWICKGLPVSNPLLNVKSATAEDRKGILVAGEGLDVPRESSRKMSGRYIYNRPPYTAHYTV